MRQVLIRRDDESDCWVADCLSLPGCISDGDTIDEALTNIQEAIAGWQEAAIASGIEIPVDDGTAVLLNVASDTAGQSPTEETLASI